MHWGRKRPGDPGHAPRIGAGNGALGQTTARGSGARPAHWGRQRRIGAGKLPTPMPVFLPQCGSPYSGAHCGRGPEPRSTPKNAPSAPRSSTGIISGADRLRPTHAPSAPRFHSDTAIRVGDSAGCPAQRLCFQSDTTLSQGYQSPQQPNGPEKRWDSEGKSLQTTPNRPDFPLRTRHRLQNIPSPRPSTILLCVTKVRRVPQPALHAPGQTRARIGAENGALEQETDHWGRLITCPNAD